MMMSALSLDVVGMSSQSAGNSQVQQSVIGATVLTRAVSEPLSVLTASYAVDYQSPRSFVIGSPLHAYLAIKTPQFVNANQRVFNLKQVCNPNWSVILIAKTHYLITCFFSNSFQVLFCLRDAIKEGGLFDRMNPSLVICDQELEKALDVKAVHLSQIR